MDFLFLQELRKEVEKKELDIAKELQKKSLELIEANKSLHEAEEEKNHEKNRREMYEAEVKKLRGKIDELKKELSTSEQNVRTAVYKGVVAWGD